MSVNAYSEKQYGRLQLPKPTLSSQSCRSFYIMLRGRPKVLTSTESKATKERWEEMAGKTNLESQQKQPALIK